MQKDKEREELISKVEKNLSVLRENNYPELTVLKIEWEKLKEGKDMEEMQMLSIQIERLTRATKEIAETEGFSLAPEDNHPDKTQKVSNTPKKDLKQTGAQKTSHENDEPKEVQLSEDPVTEVKASDGTPQEVQVEKDPSELTYEVSGWELVEGTELPKNGQWKTDPSLGKDQTVVAGYAIICDGQIKVGQQIYAKSGYPAPVVRERRNNTQFKNDLYELKVKIPDSQQCETTQERTVWQVRVTTK